MTEAAQDFSQALSQAQSGYRTACQAFRRVLHRALPHVDQLGRENAFFTTPFLRLMHDQARRTMPPVVHVEVGAALQRFADAESILTYLTKRAHQHTPDQDLGSLSTRAAQLSATFGEISSALEELLA